MTPFGLIAATHLGNPNRWTELFNLNRDRAEPGGRLVHSRPHLPRLDTGAPCKCQGCLARQSNA